MRDAGIELVQTKVGDRYVLEEMRANGFSIGGEQSGHMILLEHNSTGDGLDDGMSVPGGGSSKRKAGRGGHQVMTRFPKR